MLMNASVSFDPHLCRFRTVQNRSQANFRFESLQLMPMDLETLQDRYKIDTRVHFYHLCRIWFVLYPSKDFVSLCEDSSFVAFIVNWAFMTESGNAKNAFIPDTVPQVCSFFVHCHY